jgi:hypothetical protein
MMNHDNRRPVALEDILRLKRAERPLPEFWTHFDRELRAKQLAALVEKRPWWSVVPRVLTGLSRYHVPLGATAVLALSIVSYREFRQVSPSPVPPLGARTVPAAATVAGAETGSVAVRRNAGSPAPATVAYADEGGSQSRSSDLALDSDSPRSSSPAPAFTAGIAALGSDYNAPDGLPGARLIGDKLMSAQQVALVRDAVNASRGFESRVLPARTPKVDPLAQMASPADARRAWLLNAALASASATQPARSGDRVARRLTTDRFYDDTVSRFDAHGNSLAVRF